jgi:hypothetical protein
LSYGAAHGQQFVPVGEKRREICGQIRTEAFRQRQNIKAHLSCEQESYVCSCVVAYKNNVITNEYTQTPIQLEHHLVAWKGKYFNHAPFEKEQLTTPLEITRSKSMCVRGGSDKLKITTEVPGTNVIGYGLKALWNQVTTMMPP